MRNAVGIGQAAAEHHVTTALAMHRPGLREAAQAVEEAARRRDCPGMQLGIAARQPTGVAILRRRLIRRAARSGTDRPHRPRASPPRHADRRRKRLHRARWRDPASGCGQGRGGVAALPTIAGSVVSPATAMTASRSIAAAMASASVEPRMEIGRLAGLHQPEMAFAGRIRLASRGSAPSTGRPIRSMLLPHQSLMPRARDLVEDDASDA